MAEQRSRAAAQERQIPGVGCAVRKEGQLVNAIPDEAARKTQ
jgi:hypothetical protein